MFSGANKAKRTEKRKRKNSDKGVEHIYRDLWKKEMSQGAKDTV